MCRCALPAHTHTPLTAAPSFSPLPPPSLPPPSLHPSLTCGTTSPGFSSVSMSAMWSVLPRGRSSWGLRALLATSAANTGLRSSALNSDTSERLRGSSPTCRVAGRRDAGEVGTETTNHQQKHKQDKRSRQGTGLSTRHPSCCCLFEAPSGVVVLPPSFPSLHTHRPLV